MKSSADPGLVFLRVQVNQVVNEPFDVAKPVPPAPFLREAFKRASVLLLPCRPRDSK
ncbi:hypothetical protein U8335_20335 [Roseiconus lacunae]|uniref:hypothetical protein n=1 Tax=Roseiconus lacunae TaxID=2605694 RepID=UPI0030922128|nr:hypothetical protein U8335_20335 [Stieleria sp. HD01]